MEPFNCTCQTEAVPGRGTGRTQALQQVFVHSDPVVGNRETDQGLLAFDGYQDGAGLPERFDTVVDRIFDQGLKQEFYDLVLVQRFIHIIGYGK